MHREYHKWYSSRLNRDMELLLFGTGGRPVLVFPTSMGRFYQNEDFSLIGALADKIERAEIQAVCVDSVDAESWYSSAAHPAERARRHDQYDRYLRDELIPLILRRAAAGG